MLAIDLPLKALIWEDDSGKVGVSYNSPEYLTQRHNIPDGLVANIARDRWTASKSHEKRDLTKSVRRSEEQSGFRRGHENYVAVFNSASDSW
jgi:hypothetical protein